MEFSLFLKIGQINYQRLCGLKSKLQHECLNMLDYLIMKLFKLDFSNLNKTITFFLTDKS